MAPAALRQRADALNRKSKIWIFLAALALAAGAVSMSFAQESAGQRSGVNRGTIRRAPVRRTAAARRQPTVPAGESGTPADTAPSDEPSALPDVTSEPEAADDSGTSGGETSAAPEETTTPDDASAPAEIVVPGTETDVFEGDDPSHYQSRCTQCGGFDCKCAPPVCPPTWYVEADAVWLQRNASGKRRIAQTFTTIVINNVPITGPVERGDAHSLFFKFEPGTRVTVGRHLFRDFLERDHSIEATYLGWYDWGTSGSVRAPQRTVTAVQGDVAFVTGDLFTPFPTNTAGFGRADFINQQYSSTFQNFEFNYRIRRSLGQDRLIASPDGTWEREITPQGVPSFLMGFRYIEIKEQYHLQSISDILAVFIPLNLPFAAAVAQGNYDISTSNRLFGFQIGGDWVHEHARFNWGGRGKFGLFGNAASQTTDITTTQDIAAASVDPARSYTKSRGAFSFVGEFGLMTSWHLTPHLSLRAAYDFMWVANIAVAPEQLNFQIGGPNILNTGGFRFLQGPSLGGVVTW